MKTLLLAAALLLAAQPALAQPSQASIAGRWSFATVKSTPRGCIITGEATLTQTAQANIFRVDMTTHEVCDTGDEWRSAQNCVATRNGSTLGLDCNVVRAQPSNYAPDNFSLRIENAGLMQGHLISSWSASATWRRSGGDLVS